MSNIDWKIVAPIAIGCLLAGTALGTFVLGEKYVNHKAKSKAKKEAETTKAKLRKVA